MIAPTHLSFAFMIVFAFGIYDFKIAFLMLLGSIIPDLDHQRSFIGRIFFFISHPLNKKFGHRNITHSMVLWFPLFVLGITNYRWALWLSIGAITHLYLDCWNKTGIALFRPVSEKIFVMAGKRHRVKVGSKNEMIIMVVLMMLAVMFFYINRAGGVRGLIRNSIGDYRTAYHEYEKAGINIVHFRGKLRRSNGIIEEGIWLVIGKNNFPLSCSIWDEEEKEMIKVPEDAEFLRAIAEVDEKKRWNITEIDFPMAIKRGKVFYKAGRNWNRAKMNDVVMGDVISLEVMSFMRAVEE